MRKKLVFSVLFIFMVSFSLTGVAQDTIMVSSFVVCDLPVSEPDPGEINKLYEFSCLNHCKYGGLTSIGFTTGWIEGWSPDPPTLGTGRQISSFICPVCGTEVSFVRYLTHSVNTGEWKIIHFPDGQTAKWHKFRWHVSKNIPKEWVSFFRLIFYDLNRDGRIDIQDWILKTKSRLAPARTPSNATRWGRIRKNG